MGVWSMGFTIQDENNKKAVTRFYAPDTLTAAQAAEGAQLLAGLIDAVVGGKITSISLCLIVALPGGLKANPAANTDVEEGARFGWLTSQANLASNRFATFLETKLTGEVVNQADAAVTALKNAIISGIAVTAGTMTFVDSRGEDITSLSSARDQHKKER